MNKNIEQWGRYLFPGLVILVLLGACASPPAAVTVQETATITLPTPDPLYTLHCIRESGKNDLCYAGELLAADPERLEKAIKDFCLTKEQDFWCYVYVWRDEASVAQSTPLTPAEEASRIAFLYSNSSQGRRCYKTYSNGEVVSSSGDCQ